MNDLIAVARECGAETGTWLDDPSTWIKFDSEAALAAFAERIRAEEREWCEQDAKRYQWLRDEKSLIGPAIEDGHNYKSGAAFDAAVDAAMTLGATK